MSDRKFSERPRAKRPSVDTTTRRSSRAPRRSTRPPRETTVRDRRVVRLSDEREERASRAPRNATFPEAASASQAPRSSRRPRASNAPESRVSQAPRSSRRPRASSDATESRISRRPRAASASSVVRSIRPSRGPETRDEGDDRTSLAPRTSSRPRLSAPPRHSLLPDDQEMDARAPRRSRPSSSAKKAPTVFASTMALLGWTFLAVSVFFIARAQPPTTLGFFENMTGQMARTVWDAGDLTTAVALLGIAWIGSLLGLVNEVRRGPASHDDALKPLLALNLIAPLAALAVTMGLVV